MQSVEQFVFIYRALAEYQLFGDTDLSVTEFRSFYTRLRQPITARERHVSIGSSSARSNSIAAGAATSVLSDASDKPLICNNPLVGNHSSASSSGFKARLRQVAKNGISTGTSTPTSTNPVNTPTASQPQNLTRLTLLEAEFNVSTFIWRLMDR